MEQACAFLEPVAREFSAVKKALRTPGSDSLLDIDNRQKSVSSCLTVSAWCVSFARQGR